MGFVDEAVVKAKEVFDVAAKKTGDVVETQKLRYKAFGLKSELSKKYEQLGRAYFAQLKDDEDIAEKAQVLVEEIEAKNEEYLEIRDLINSYKNLCTCENCGAKNAKDALFCSKCGEQL